MIFNKYDRIVFAGDSITDCDRKKPEGEGSPVNHPLGYGFVNLLFGHLHAIYPEMHLHIINQGTSGFRSNDLLNRFDEILSYEPNWVFVMIGVNDVWRHFDCPEITKNHISCTEYKDNVEKMIKKTLNKGIKMMLISPFIIEENKQEKMRKVLTEFQIACIDLCHTYNLVYIDVQKAFDRVLEHISTYEIARDRVHPNITGHTLIMQTILSHINEK